MVNELVEAIKDCYQKGNSKKALALSAVLAQYLQFSMNFPDEGDEVAK